MRSLTAFVFILSFSLFQAQTLRKIKGSSVTFKIKNAGIWVDGKFGTVSGSIKFDEKATNNSIDCQVAANSVNTNNAKRDKHLNNEDFFEVEKFPAIKITSTKITHKDAEHYEGNFKITMKSTTKEVNIPFTFKNNVFSGTLTLNRKDYGVGGKNLILSDDAIVVVVIAVE